MVPSEPTGAPAPAPAASDALRLVLFGLPAAGKTSLLGALGQAARLQPHLLGGLLRDPDHRLEALARQVYDGPPRRTVEEVLAYPVHFEPSPRGDPERAGPADLVLLDCDGSVVNDLLNRRAELDEHSPEGSLTGEIVRADAILLAIDAASPRSQVEADFTAFARFLQAMQRGRGRRTEVAGLPVFLVLTKCDLLAQPGDSVAEWMDRIEQRKRDVDAHFRTFLSDEAARQAAEPRAVATADAKAPPPREPSPFGRIDLHVWATAMKRPPLSGAAARPHDPYGVAELFRQSLDEARAYRQARTRSHRRLVGLVTVLSLLVVLTGGLAAFLWLSALDARAAMLQARAEDFRAAYSGPPGERLRGDPEALRDRIERLEKIHGDDQFGRLPRDLQTFVETRLDELNAYLAYLRKLLAERPPGEARSEEGLEQALHKLRGELALPDPEWQETLAGQLHGQRLASAEALRRAVLAVRNWYLDSSDQASRLWTFATVRGTAIDGGIDWAEWTSQVETMLQQRQGPPFRDAEPVPGVNPPLLYATVFRFDRVAEARTGWELDRARLVRLLDVSSALGLATPSKSRPPVLVLPRDLSLAACKGRLAELKAAYPDYDRTFTRTDLPDAAVPTLRQAARRQYRLLLEPAHAEVLRQLRLSGSGETVASWEPVRAWLRQPEELLSWRELARVLLRLDDPAAEDPVKALAAFLARTEFALEVRALELEVPEVRGLRPGDESRLVVLHPASGRQPALAFEASGEPRRDPARRTVVYTFRPVAGHKLTYRPGDKLWAELPLRGARDRLVWSQARSSLYQFERLRRPPRLQGLAATTLDEGRVFDDVTLTPRPEDGVPVVPELLPPVRPGE